jgi:hypothetical protein
MLRRAAGAARQYLGYLTIEVIGEKLAVTEALLFVTKITFVNVAPDGQPMPLTG